MVYFFKEFETKFGVDFVNVSDEGIALTHVKTKKQRSFFCVVKVLQEHKIGKKYYITKEHKKIEISRILRYKNNGHSVSVRIIEHHCMRIFVLYFFNYFLNYVCTLTCTLIYMHTQINFHGTLERVLI